MFRTHQDLPLVAAFAALIVLANTGCSRSGDSTSEQDDSAVAADLILRGGRIVTVAPDFPEAQALAARDGRIVSVGSDAKINELAGPDTEIIELDGRLAIPGFIEGHGHFMGLGEAKLILDLRHAKSWDEIITQVAEACAKAEHGEWVRGRGWHQDKWDSVPQPNVEGFPLHHGLSKVSPDNPVLLTHASGHAAFVNAKALELAGIDHTRKDPPGGEFLRDANGQPTGCLREAAGDLVSSIAYQTSTDAEWERRLRKVATLAAQECLQNGVTTFHDAGVGFEEIDFYRKLADEGDLPIRLWVMVGGAPINLATRLSEYRTIGYGNDRLTVRAIKLSIDGALGSRGAWLLQPYADAPDLSGLNVISLDDVRRTAKLALKHNYQLCTHAIGDRANREILDIYESALQSNPNHNDMRWRVEHAQHLDPADIPRFSQLSVIASVQAVHCTSDGPWVPDRIGAERASQGAYVWRKLIDSGAVVMNGTDVPVEPLDPIANFAAAVTRRLDDGTEFYPDQRMTRMEALQSATINAAHGAFEDDLKGSLSVGKLADIAVLSGDILKLPETELKNVHVDLTIVGGEVAFRRD